MSQLDSLILIAAAIVVAWGFFLLVEFVLDVFEIYRDAWRAERMRQERQR
jgi:hypothetical protein